MFLGSYITLYPEHWDMAYPGRRPQSKSGAKGFAESDRPCALTTLTISVEGRHLENFRHILNSHKRCYSECDLTVHKSSQAVSKPLQKGALSIYIFLIHPTPLNQISH
ncbi:cytochrome p450 [Moniliophthora roreri]|nr:cytochrome p450 [Moniliophthora roreri]